MRSRNRLSHGSGYTRMRFCTDYSIAYSRPRLSHRLVTKPRARQLSYNSNTMRNKSYCCSPCFLSASNFSRQCCGGVATEATDRRLRVRAALLPARDVQYGKFLDHDVTLFEMWHQRRCEKSFKRWQFGSLYFLPRDAL